MIHPRELARLLTLREWLRLCEAVDVTPAARAIMSRHGDGSDVQTVAGGKVACRFDVLKIERLEDRVVVTLELEGSKEPRRCELRAAA